MLKDVVKISKNTKETSKIAKMFLWEILKKGNPKQGALVVGLRGDLGAGKTTFFQAIAKHLGIKDKVISPTFVIMKKYPLKNKKYNFLFHLDAYRLKNEKELLNLGWEEIVKNNKNLIFIEWPENVEKIIPSYSQFVHIFDDKNNQKHLKLK